MTHSHALSIIIPSLCLSTTQNIRYYIYTHECLNVHTRRFLLLLRKLLFDALPKWNAHMASCPPFPASSCLFSNFLQSISRDPRMCVVCVFDKVVRESSKTFIFCIFQFSAKFEVLGLGGESDRFSRRDMIHVSFSIKFNKCNNDVLHCW